jgi:hypothetical protein
MNAGHAHRGEFMASARASRLASASPRLHLVPTPNSAAGVLAKRSGEPLLLGDLVGTLLGHTEELGDLDKTEIPHMLLTLAGLPEVGTARETSVAECVRWLSGDAHG